MAKPNRFLSQILFLLLTTIFTTIAVQGAAPVGQTIWIRATSSGLFRVGGSGPRNMGAARC